MQVNLSCRCQSEGEIAAPDSFLIISTLMTLMFNYLFKQGMGLTAGCMRGSQVYYLKYTDMDSVIQKSETPRGNLII